LQDQLGKLLSAGLLAPHRGRIKSAGAAFIRAVNLTLALVLTNYGNRYGFPAREVLARCRRHKTLLLDTGTRSALTLVVQPLRGVNLREGYRSANRRYRHSLPWCFASQKITRVLARQTPGIAFSD
jgi:beta-lactamase superfamily II metal-dependent hydrolase